MRSKIKCLLLSAALIYCPQLAIAVTHIITTGSGGNNFSPLMLTVAPGDTVKWEWSSGYHNTSSASLPTSAATWYSNITAALTSFIYVPTVSGLYKYSCTFHSSMDGQFFVTGCSYPSKPAVASTGGNAACSGAGITLSTAPQAGAGYQWIDGTTTISGANAPTYTATASGNYKIVVNRCGVDSVSAPFVITINPLPVASFTYSNSGLAYTFTNTSDSVNVYNYRWSFSDGAADQLTKDAVHNFAVPGSYTVTLKATQPVTGCADTAQIILLASLGVEKTVYTPYVIYPNPASSLLYINAGYGAAIWLSDMEGCAIAIPVKAYSSQQCIADLSRLSGGLYLLHVNGPAGNAVEKIIVTR